MKCTFSFTGLREAWNSAFLISSEVVLMQNPLAPGPHLNSKVIEAAYYRALSRRWDVQSGVYFPSLRIFGDVWEIVAVTIREILLSYRGGARNAAKHPSKQRQPPHK